MAFRLFRSFEIISDSREVTEFFGTVKFLCEVAFSMCKPSIVVLNHLTSQFIHRLSISGYKPSALVVFVCFVCFVCLFVCSRSDCFCLVVFPYMLTITWYLCYLIFPRQETSNLHDINHYDDLHNNMDCNHCHISSDLIQFTSDPRLPSRSTENSEGGGGGGGGKEDEGGWTLPLPRRPLSPLATEDCVIVRAKRSFILGQPLLRDNIRKLIAGDVISNTRKKKSTLYETLCD